MSWAQHSMCAPCCDSQGCCATVLLLSLPVALLTGPGRGWLVEAVAKAYPGRAAMTPLLDLLTTLLYWGAAGWRQQLQQREELYTYLRCALVADGLEIRLLQFVLVGCSEML